MAGGRSPAVTGLYRTFGELEAVLAEPARRSVRIRYSHQPNVLATLAVLAPCAVASFGADSAAVARRSVTWVSVDYDGADDEQLLRVRLPRFNPTLGTRMTAALSRREVGRRLASSIPSAMALPRIASLEQELVGGALALRHQLARRGWQVNTRSTCRGRISDGIAVFRQALADQGRLCDALAGHNRWMVEQHFGIIISVVSGTDWLLGQSGDRLTVLLAIAAERPDLVRGGIWRVCVRCYVRTRVYCRFGQSGAEVEESRCGECGESMPRAPLDLGAVVDSPAGECPAYVLPVQLDDLVERVTGPEFDLAIHYPGSYAHLATSREILSSLQGDVVGSYDAPPDWCPTHLDLNTLTDTFLSNASPVGAGSVRDALVSRLPYRVSAIVSWSVFAGDLRRNMFSTALTGDRLD